jgi:hypothetical protein
LITGPGEGGDVYYFSHSAILNKNQLEVA